MKKPFVAGLLILCLLIGTVPVAALANWSASSRADMKREYNSGQEHTVELDFSSNQTTEDSPQNIDVSIHDTIKFTLSKTGITSGYNSCSVFVSKEDGVIVNNGSPTAIVNVTPTEQQSFGENVESLEWTATTLKPGTALLVFTAWDLHKHY